MFSITFTLMKRRIDAVSVNIDHKNYMVFIHGFMPRIQIFLVYKFLYMYQFLNLHHIIRLTLRSNLSYEFNFLINTVQLNWDKLKCKGNRFPFCLIWFSLFLYILYFLCRIGKKNFFFIAMVGEFEEKRIKNQTCIW